MCESFSSDPKYYAGGYQAGKVDGIVGPGTLGALKKVWEHYFKAYVAMPGKSKYTLNDVPSDWWDSISTLLDKGGTVPYVSATTSYTVPATYTTATHTAITSEFPADATNLTVPGILRAWVAQESGSNYWGFGYPNTPYRITEGGADEYGSMGFNHILWMRLYGTENRCNALRGYIGDTDNINLYHPKNSLLALMVAATSGSCGSANGFYLAYNAPGIVSTANASTKPLSYCYEYDASFYGKDAPVAANSCAKSPTTWKAYGGSDDAYDILAKAIMLYNTGSGQNNIKTKEAMVDHLRTDAQEYNDSGVLKATNYAYPMQIKQLSWNRRLTGGGYLPYRTYIWKGGIGVDVNKDGTIADIPADPMASPPTPAVVETTLPWCFAYGEKEWVAGKVWDDVKQAADDVDKEGDAQTPVGRIDCVTGAVL